MKYQYSTIGVLLYNIRYSDTQVNIEGKLDYFNAHCTVAEYYRKHVKYAFCLN